MANALLRYFAPYNGFMPHATGQVIGYIRKPEAFTLNQYCQYVPTPAVKGYYYYMGRDLPVSLPSVDGNPATGSADVSVWAGGASRKEPGRANQAVFTTLGFETTRRNQSAHVDWLTRDMAELGGLHLLTFYASALASKNMTLRTKLALDQLDNSANWPAGHAQDANTLNNGYGKWSTASDDPNSPFYNAIRRSIMAAVARILLDTNNQVEEKDLVLVIGPDLAQKMQAAPEIVNYVRESPSASEMIEGRHENFNARFGLPQYIFGVRLIVEAAAVVAQFDMAAGTTGGIVEATGNRRFLKNPNSAILLSRPGGLDGIYGAMNYSTLQIYYYDGTEGVGAESAGPGGLMAVEAFDDVEDRLTRLHVSENISVVPPTYTGYSGMLITNCM